MVRVFTAGYMRFVPKDGGKPGPLMPRKVWRCDYCGYTEPFFEHHVFGACAYCFAKVVELPYIDNFRDFPVRLLTWVMARPDMLEEGEYRYGCSACVRCYICRKMLPNQDFDTRGARTYEWDGSMKIDYMYMHKDCSLEWDRKYAAENLTGPLIDIKDVIDTIANHKRMDALSEAMKSSQASKESK
jgi:hypothetical protein